MSFDNLRAFSSKKMRRGLDDGIDRMLRMCPENMQCPLCNSLNMNHLVHQFFNKEYYFQGMLGKAFLF